MRSARKSSLVLRSAPRNCEKEYRERKREARKSEKRLQEIAKQTLKRARVAALASNQVKKQRTSPTASEKVAAKALAALISSALEFQIRLISKLTL